MERSYWVYRNEECGFAIEKVPIYIDRDEEQGDSKKGYVTFKSTEELDEFYGPNIKIEVNWEPIDKFSYHHGKTVSLSIKAYNSMGVSITKRDSDWIKNHEWTIWKGTKKELKKGRIYSMNIVHSIIYCEFTERLFEMHAVVASKFYSKYEKEIVEMMRRINCHDL
ncbi:MAG: hypothetical protein ACTSRZ_12350 [Promethearchaeota archaeon]